MLPRMVSAAIEANRGVGKVRAGFAIPSPELHDLDLFAASGAKFSSEIAGKPARLQFEFVRNAPRGGALVRGRDALDALRRIGYSSRRSSHINNEESAAAWFQTR